MIGIRCGEKLSELSIYGEDQLKFRYKDIEHYLELLQTRCCNISRPSNFKFPLEIVTCNLFFINFYLQN
jgi:hypothetical protein